MVDEALTILLPICTINKKTRSHRCLHSRASFLTFSVDQATVKRILCSTLLLPLRRTALSDGDINFTQDMR